MNKVDIERVKSIFGDYECHKGLRCIESGLEGICKAQDIGLHSLLVCLEDDKHCPFILPAGKVRLCRCSVRLYIAREFKK